ncbi:MAG TPA: PEP-CTERM sorting domain-containing protein [Bryobacteraceae bacterium]|nr:PEP-CTERM sorting domain-containing protein [Bryobacteraceae bacterium]
MDTKKSLKIALFACFVSTAGITLTPGTLQADTIAYALPGSTFGTVDLNTGIYTPTTTTGAGQAQGLGVYNGNLYGDDHQFTDLIQINPTTGAVTSAPTPYNLNEAGFGSTTAGLFLIQAGTPTNLYSINPTTGAATLIGPTGITAGGGNGALSVSNDSGALYWAVQSLSVAGEWSLYSLNTSTGAATLLGTTLDNPNAGGPGLGDGEVNALLLEGGTLWAEFGNNTGPTIGTINTTNAAATVLEAESQTGGGQQNFVGLAPDPLSPTSPPPTVPEPATLALLGAGLGAIGLLRCFRSSAARR